MKIFLVGAGGGVGTRLARILVDRGDEVTGMHRRPEQAAAVLASGATPIVGDLITDSIDALAEKFAGQDAIVFAAGAHGTGATQTTLIDGRGLAKSADAAVVAGVRTFVLVSVFPDALRDGEPSEGFEHYMRVKKTADVHLTRSGLDWLIVRPGTLTDAPGSGRVTAGPAVEYGDVSRDNVASFIARALQEPALRRQIVELVDGDTPIADAVTTLR